MCCSFTYLCYISECYIDVPVRQARLCLRKKQTSPRWFSDGFGFRLANFSWGSWSWWQRNCMTWIPWRKSQLLSISKNQQNQYLGQMFFRCFEANDTKSTETPVPGVARSLLCLRSRQEFGSDRFGMVGCSTWTTHKINLGLFNLQAWQCHSISVFN